MIHAAKMVDDPSGGSSQDMCPQGHFPTVPCNAQCQAFELVPHPWPGESCCRAALSSPVTISSCCMTCIKFVGSPLLSGCDRMTSWLKCPICGVHLQSELCNRIQGLFLSHTPRSDHPEVSKDLSARDVPNISDVCS